MGSADVSSAPDVVVVGAGLVGAMTALGLAEAGLSVTLLEGDFPGAGSTGAAMGHVVAMDDSPAQLALTAHSRARWIALAPTLPSRGEYQACGTLWLAATDAEMESARARIPGYCAVGVAAELLDERSLRATEPALRPGLAGAMLVPDDAVCYPPAIVRTLCERAARLGVALRHATVEHLDAQRVVLRDGSVLACGAIVVAAGATSPAIVPGLPVVPRKGHLVITDRHPRLVRHQLVELGYLHSAHSFGGASVAFNLQPRSTGQLLIGSSRELVGFDTGINRPLLAEMMRRAIAMIPGLAETRALRSWTGFRPATADKLPLIGRWPELDGVWIATGHEGLGITMAPGTADLIVAGITGNPAPVDPTPFDPGRTMATMAAAA
jgi:glycine/D-amino acid oxidase-like deaminating enzyme